MTVDVRIRRCRLTVRGGARWTVTGAKHVDAAMAGVEAAIEAALVAAQIAPGVDVHIEEPLALEIGNDGAGTPHSQAALVERLRAAAGQPLAAPGDAGARHGPPAANDDPLASRARDPGAAPSGLDAPAPEQPSAPGTIAGDDPPRARAPARPDEPSAADAPPPGDRSDDPPHDVAGAPPASPAAAHAFDPAAAADGGADRPAVAGRPGATTGGAATPTDRGAAGDLRREGVDATSRPAGGVASPHGPVAVSDADAAALARTLARWSRAGQLAQVVGAWPTDLVGDWLAAIDAAGRSSSHALTAEAVDAIADAVLDARPAGVDRGHRLLILLGALTSALDERLPDARTQLLARHRISPGAGARPAAAGAPRHAAARARPVPTAEQVVPALPFLVLAQLCRIGYTDAMTAAAAGAGVQHGDAALAAALVSRVLPAPAPGGRREPPEDTARALASATPAASLDEALDELAGHEAALLPPLALALQGAYADGRATCEELLVTACAAGIVCGEERGLLPAAWVASDAELGAVLASLGGPPVRRADAFAALARELHARPGVPAAPALERHLGAAAGTALGLLALGLWAGSETPTPLLALARLGDLEALVRSGPSGLVVSIPRGQRWLDLQRGGLLDLFTIPWLPGGRLEVGSW